MDAAIALVLVFVWTVHTNFHAKSGLCSSKNEWVMLNLVFGSLTTAWWQFDDSLMTAWRQLNIFHTYFHAKSGLCSSRNEWVMLNLVFARARAAPSRPCDQPTYRAARFEPANTEGAKTLYTIELQLYYYYSTVTKVIFIHIFIKYKLIIFRK